MHGMYAVSIRCRRGENARVPENDFIIGLDERKIRDTAFRLRKIDHVRNRSLLAIFRVNAGYLNGCPEVPSLYKYKVAQIDQGIIININILLVYTTVT